MKIRILPSALEDLAGGREFYEKQADGAGDYFMDSLFSDVDSLALYAGIHRKVLGYFRLLSKRFPYAIYYTMESDAAIVWRILDCRRDPVWIRKQLKTD